MRILIHKIAVSAAFFLLAAAAAGAEVISIPPTALKPADYASNNLPWVSGPDAFYFAAGPSTAIDASAFAPLSNLPDKIRITGLTVYALDNACGAGQGMSVSLIRHDLETGQLQVMAEVTTDGLACQSGRQVLEDGFVEFPVTDTSRASYALAVRFFKGTDQIRFLGAKLAFEGFKIIFK